MVTVLIMVNIVIGADNDDVDEIIARSIIIQVLEIKFQEWPVDALHGVATKFLSKLELPDELLRKCVDLCQEFQVTSKVVAIKYMSELGRIVYITPMSYLELIGMFQLIFVSKTTFVLMHSFIHSFLFIFIQLKVYFYTCISLSIHKI